MADKIKTLDGKYSAQVWHEYCKQKFLGCEDIKLPNRKILTYAKSTADLDTSEFSEYCDKVEHFAGSYLANLDE